MSKVLVSVIVPNYNYAHFLPVTIQSVLDQSFSNFELIVVDDGSTDDSVDVILKYCEKDSRVRLIKKSNTGLSATRNVGIKNAKGDYIAFLDSDDFWAENKLESQMTLLKEEGTDVVYSDYAFYSNDVKVPHVKSLIKENLNMYDFISENPILGSASSVMIKSSKIFECGFFDEQLKSLEDLDYWFRLALINCKFSFTNVVHVYLRQHPNSMLKNPNVMYNNHKLVLNKQMNLLSSYKVNVDENKLHNALSERIVRMRWYASDAKSLSKMIDTFFMFMKHLGIIKFLKMDFKNLKLLFNKNYFFSATRV